MKKQLLVFFILITSFNIKSQNIIQVSEKNISTKGKLDEFFKVFPDKGIVQITRLWTGEISTNFYDLSLEKKWNHKKIVSGIKNMKLEASIETENQMSLFFYKKRGLGFFPSSKLTEIIISEDENSFKAHRYRMKNYNMITGIQKFNGSTIITGTEAYKPWHPWRIYRFGGLGISAALGTSAGTFLPVTAFLSAITWPLPTIPRIRPSIIELKDGKKTYLHRKEFKKKYYFNKGIHTSFTDGNQLYLGLTSSVRKSKTPIIIEKYDKDLTLIGSNKVKTDKKHRVRAFKFERVDDNFASFKSAYGNKLFTFFGLPKNSDKLETIKTVKGAVNFTEDKTSVVKEDFNGLVGSNINEVYKSITRTIIYSKKYAGTYNKEKHEVEIFETREPVIVEELEYVSPIQSSVSGQNTFGGYKRKQVFKGFNYKNMLVKISNLETGEVNEYPIDFFRFDSSTSNTTQLMHATANFTSKGIVVSYLETDSDIASIIFNNQQKNEAISSINIKENDDKEIKNSYMDYLSENKFIVIKNSWKIKSKENKGKRNETLIKIFEVK